MNKKDIQIIGFCGAIGSGKDYQSSLFVQQGYTKIAFADPLRSLIWSLLKWEPRDDREYSMFKETFFNSLPKKIPSFNGRDVLENLGEGAKNLFGKTIWVDAWEKILLQLYTEHGINRFTVSDVRFKQEILRLFEYDAKIIFCNYHSNRYTLNKNSPSQTLAHTLSPIFKDGDDVTDYLKEIYEVKNEAFSIRG